MKTVDELIEFYQKRMAECAQERDRIIDSWNSEGRFMNVVNETDIKRIAGEWEEARKIARDTISWLQAVKHQKSLE